MIDRTHHEHVDEGRIKEAFQNSTMSPSLEESELNAIEGRLLEKVRELKLEGAVKSRVRATRVGWMALGAAGATVTMTALFFLFSLFPGLQETGTYQRLRSEGASEHPRDVTQYMGFEASNPSPEDATAEEEIRDATRIQLNSAPELENCGIHSLWAAVRSLDHQTDMNLIRWKTPIPPREDVSFMELKEIADLLGYRAQGIRITWEELFDLQNPAILFLSDNHFVCVEPILPGAWRYPGTVLVDDPLKPRRFVGEEELLAKWDGAALIVSFRDEGNAVNPSEGQTILAESKRTARLTPDEMRSIRGAVCCDECTGVFDAIDECAHFEHDDPCSATQCIHNILTEDTCQVPATQTACQTIIDYNVVYLVQELHSDTNCSTDNPSTWQTWRTLYFSAFCATKKIMARCQKTSGSCTSANPVDVSERKGAIKCN